MLLKIVRSLKPQRPIKLHSVFFFWFLFLNIKLYDIPLGALVRFFELVGAAFLPLVVVVVDEVFVMVVVLAPGYLLVAVLPVAAGVHLEPVGAVTAPVVVVGVHFELVGAVTERAVVVGAHFELAGAVTVPAPVSAPVTVDVE